MIEMGATTVVFDDNAPHVDRFGWLLAVTATSVVVLSLVDVREPIGDAGGELGAALFTVSVGATLLLAMRAAGVARRWTIAADVFVLVSVFAAVGFLLLDLLVDEDLTRFESDRPSPLWGLMSAIAPAVVVARLLRHRQVTKSTLMGAVCGFLLLSLSFFFAFLSVGSLQDADFFGDPEPTTSFMYFSLVTITTLGYGDLAATTELGRLFAGIEAVTGQVYLVTFIAFLVSLYATARARR